MKPVYKNCDSQSVSTVKDEDYENIRKIYTPTSEERV